MDAKSGAVERSKSVGKIDPFGLPGYITRVRWSPDGRHLGVVAGKGLKPGIVDPTDLSITWAGGMMGGRMALVFDVAWTPGGELLTGSDRVLAVDSGDGSQRILVDRAECSAVLAVGNEGEILLLAAPTLRRIDPKTGAVAWSR